MKKKEKVCVICGEVFEPANNNVKTCSEVCVRQQRNLNHQKFLAKRAGIQLETKKVTCYVCDKEFETSDNRVKTCSTECREEYVNNQKKYALKQQRLSLTKEGVDHVICKWCGEKVTRVYGKHMTTYHPGKTSTDYKKEFPGALMQTSADKINISKNSGQHMKQEKYRMMASIQITGERNPNHSSKTTELERKERSPFSSAFYEKRNLNETDRMEFITSALDGREFETRVEYWTDRGFSEQEAKEKIHDRQITFSLKKCIERHGEEKGLEVWKERQEKWKSKVFNSETHIGGGTSILAQYIIDEIIKYNSENTELNFGKNEKFISDINNERVYKYDITNKSNRRIIEINGVFWHCKPAFYDPEYFHKVKQLFAQEIWDYDKRKTEIAESYGYTVLTIWEDEYHLDPEATIKKCVDFIYSA